MSSNQKIGATPLIEGASSGKAVLGILPVKWRGMVHFRDGLSATQTKMVVIFTNDDVYFEENGKFIPAQTWFKQDLLGKLASQIPTDNKVDPSNISAVEQG